MVAVAVDQARKLDLGALNEFGRLEYKNLDA